MAAGRSSGDVTRSVVVQPAVYEIDELAVPPRPVMRDLAAPEIYPGRYPLFAQDLVEAAHLVDHLLLPGALPGAENQPQRPQPLEDALVSETSEIVERRVEVDVAVKRAAQEITRRIDAG